MIIAIDGVSGSGKGTISKKLGEKLSFFVIDSGLFYRYISAFGKNLSLEKKCNLVNSFNLEELNNPLLKTEEVAKSASSIAKDKQIREMVTNRLRSFSKIYNNIIVDGRDIGSVVFPDADIKFFITASLEVRALRRAQELNPFLYDQFLKEMKERDIQDMNREQAPLKKEKDAYLIDTSYLSIDEAVQEVEKIIRMI